MKTATKERLKAITFQEWLAERAEKRLAKRRAEFSIPDVPFMPSYDRVIAYRLGQEEMTGTQKSPGGIIIPDVSKQVGNRFVLLAFGLQSMDYAVGHNYELGDIVWLARFSGWEPITQPIPGSSGKHMIFVLAQDLVGSEDGLQRLKDGEVRIERGEDGIHRYKYTAFETLPRLDIPNRTI